MCIIINIIAKVVEENLLVGNKVLVSRKVMNALSLSKRKLSHY